MGTAFSGSLPRIFEIPRAEKIETNTVKDLKEFMTFKQKFQ
jgi:hypothetical protein